MAVATTKGPKTTASKLEGQLLEGFKEAVIGSNITKIELLKALKKRFPKTTNDTIKVTLESYFARVGAGAAEKRWKYIGD